jgi:hypothetical protein
MALALARPRAISPLGWVRIAVRLAAMIAMLLVAIPLYYLCRLLLRHNPVPRLFLGGVAWLSGVRLTHRGEKVHRGAFLLVNHVSWIDIPAVAAATGAAFVGHDGLASMPLLKWLCAMNDTVFVARHDRASVAAQVAQVRDLGWSHYPMALRYSRYCSISAARRSGSPGWEKSTGSTTSFASLRAGARLR